MKRIIGLLFLSFFLNISFANPVHEQDLIRFAVNAFQQKQLAAGSLPSAKIQDYRFVVQQRDTLLLIVNFSEGFIVMSADDAVMPVLAYSLDQQLENDNVAPAAQLWLDLYAEQVKYAKNHQLNPSSDILLQWNALMVPKTAKDEPVSVVAPLLTALWNQTKYYNAYSPMDVNSPSGYDNRTPNGCVAVAMAMIMYYYRYPSHGIGSHTNSNDYGDFYVDFGQATYFYEAMKDKLDHYNDEVAKLIYHCATSVDMWYGPDGSGASSSDVPDALISHFGYDSGCEYLTRHDYSLSEWQNILKSELTEKRPVYYSGCNDEGCHAFVCDGFDSEDFFHFNFGWGGSSNGYYTVNTRDTNYHNAVGGYSHSQHVITGIKPPQNAYPTYCSFKAIKCESGTLEDGSGPFDYMNNADCMYYITEDDAYKIQIVLDRFETELGFDSLSFWAGHPDRGNLLQTYSGSVPSGTSRTFNTDSLYITFKTNSSITSAGWRLKYQVSRHFNACGNSHIIREYRGTLSDGSDSAMYRSNANCFWRLYLPLASYIKFDFPLIDIAEGDHLCFYDGSVFPRELIADFSGVSSLPQQTFNTVQIVIEFITDNYLNGEGFELHWSSDYSPEGVEDLTAEDVYLFPNPASTTFNVSLPETMRDAEIFLYDVSGRLVHKCPNVGDTKVNVDVSLLPNGFYVVVIQDDKNSIKKKIIIQR